MPIFLRTDRTARWGILPLLLFACDRSPEPRERQEPAPSAAPEAPSVAASRPPQARAGVVWKEPEEWVKEQRPRPMRLATYAIPKSEKDPEDGELAVFHFGPGDGGGIEANVQRWIGQFSDVGEVRRDQRPGTSGLALHLVEITRGTYASGMPGGPTTPKPDFGLLGAIIETPGGSYFFKLTGPAALVQQEREKFFALVDSVRPGS